MKFMISRFIADMGERSRARVVGVELKGIRYSCNINSKIYNYHFKMDYFHKWEEYNFFFIFFILAEDNFALRPEIFEQELLKLQEKGKYISHLKVFSPL